MLHLQKFICSSLNAFADLVTVSRAIEEGPQYEHVQGPLEKSNPLFCLFFHRRHSTLNLAMMVDIRLSVVKSAAEGGFSNDDFSPGRVSNFGSPHSCELWVCCRQLGSANSEVTLWLAAPVNREPEMSFASC